MVFLSKKSTHIKEYKEILEVRYVLYLDCGDGFKGIRICANSSQSRH